MSSSPTPPSNPIPITAPGHDRARSGSVSSTESGGVPGLSPSDSSSPNSSFQTPQLLNKGLPPSSPILSYIFSKEAFAKSPLSPVKSAASNLSSLPPLPDDESDASAHPKSVSALGHHRSTSMSSTWSRFPISPSGPSSGNILVPPSSPPDSTNSRGAGLLRRLSLSTTFSRPALPTFMQDQEGPRPGDAPADPGLHRAKTMGPSFQGRPTGRRATLGPMDREYVKPRAPSPMGERMLKGHFDGFN